jgi:hypothetical protein
MIPSLYLLILSVLLSREQQLGWLGQTGGRGERFLKKVHKGIKFIYDCTVLSLDLSRFFSFLIYTQSVGASYLYGK